MAEKKHAYEYDEKRPEKYQTRKEPSGVLDSWYWKFHGCAIFVVSGLGQGLVPLPGRVHLLRGYRGRFPVVVLCELVRSVFNQLLYRALGALNKGPMQGREALVICCIDVCAPAEEQIHAGRVSFICGPHKRRVCLRIWNIHRYILVQQQNELVDVTIQRRGVEEVKALVVGEERVGTVLEEKVDDIIVASFGSP